MKPTLSYAAPSDRGRFKNDTLLDAVALILPFTRLVEIELIGNLFLHDILTPIVIVFLFTATPKPLGPLRMVGLMLAIWFGGAVFSDIYRSTPFEDYARGWSKILIFGLNILMVWLLCAGHPRRLTIYACATGAALCVAAILRPSDVVMNDSWKFGFGYGVSLILATLAMTSTFERWLGPYVGSMALGVSAFISLFQNSRSLFAICALAAAYSALARWISKRPKIREKLTIFWFSMLVLGGFVAAMAMVAAYGAMAESGALGDEAQAKFYDQTKGNVNFIQAGRTESLVSIEAIADSPIVGHGSWAKDPYYIQLLVVKMRELGLEGGSFYYIGTKTDFQIPTHSYLLGSWVEHGILGVPIWIYTFLLTFGALYAILKESSQPSALLSLVAFAFMWDVFFSPFAADTRILKGMELTILLLSVMSLRKLDTAPRFLGRMVSPPQARSI